MNPELVHFQCFDALKNVFDARDTVLDVIKTCPSSIICHTNNDFDESILQKSLVDLFYESDSDGRETVGYWSIAECDPILIKAIEKLNDAKEVFKQTNIKLSKIDPNSSREIAKALRNCNQWPKRLERYAPDYGRLNINHVYRKYTVATERPEKVQQSWSSKDKSIVKITKKQALNKILNIDDTLPDHLRIQYEVLSSLKDSEKLAVVRPQTPSVKTNIFFKNWTRPFSTTSKLPIIVPKGSSKILIKIFNQRSDIDSDRQRQIRADVKLEEDSIAPSIHVYRYRENYV